MSLLLLLWLLGLDDVGVQARQPDSAEPLDLAAMVLTSADLAEEGLEGFGMRSSRSPSNELVASDLAAALGTAAADLADELDAIGLVRSYDYALDLVPLSDDGAPTVRTDTVYSYLGEHEDAEGAAAGFALREENDESRTAEDIPDALEIGDESELTRFTGETQDGTELSFVGLDFTFRVDRIYAGVQLIAYAPEAERVDEPRQDDVEALARRLLERVEDGLDGDTPGLSTQVVRLSSDEPPTLSYYDWYQVIDGELLPYAGWDYEAFDTAKEGVEEFDIIDRYRVEQIIQTDPTDPEGFGNPYMVLRFNRFGDAEMAALWVDTALDRLVEPPSSYSNIEEVDGVARLGDQAVAARYTFAIDDETTVTGHAIFVRVDEIAFSLEIDGGSLESVTELAEAQLQCIDDGVCLDLVPVPDSLIDGSAGSDGDEDQTERNDPDDAATSLGNEESESQSERYAFTFSWSLS